MQPNTKPNSELSNFQFRASQFEDAGQQYQTSVLGMWAFLVTEILFFGGLFLAYFLYGVYYPEAFAAASNHLDIRLGGFNTVVLIGSSLTMALAVHAAQIGSRKKLVTFLWATIFLGTVFLGVKVIEYSEKFHHNLVPATKYLPFQFHGSAGPGAEIFFSLYFGMTGLHALHMIIGIGILLALVLMAKKGRFGKDYFTPIELTGLYWHFVDIIWIFLFPILYLIGRHHN